MGASPQGITELQEAEWTSELLERHKRQLTEDELLNLSPEELCKDRPSDEYFRLGTKIGCRDVVRFDSRFAGLCTGKN